MARTPRKKPATKKPVAKKPVAKKAPVKKAPVKKVVAKKAAATKVDEKTELSHKDMEAVIKMETQSLNRADLSAENEEDTLGKAERVEKMIRVKILVSAWGYNQGEEHILVMSEAKELMNRKIAMRMIIGDDE